MSFLKDSLKVFVPDRCWEALRQFRSHLFLMRVMPFSVAWSLIWNRIRYGFADDEDRRLSLNERKHAMIERFLKETIGEEAMAGAGAEITFPEGMEPLPIWVCWLQGEDAMPELNKVCLRSIRAHAGTHPVIFLSVENISDYVAIPACLETTYASGRILPAILADYIRCALLARYGGVWLDSTILLTDMLDDRWFSRPFMSVRHENTLNDSVSRYRWASFCLGAVPGSPFFAAVERMFRAYFGKKRRNVDYLMIDYFFDLLYREVPGVADLVDGIPDSNPEMHTLRGILGRPYDAALMSALMERTSLFKLTYKMDLRETCQDGSLTFWGYLKQNCSR